MNNMIGLENQLNKVRRITFRDGASDGVRAIELLNESGIYMTCIEDNCLNLYDFTYKGINFAFQTKNGLKNNRFFCGGADEFSFRWPAGMMYTCGLTNVGPAVFEDGIYHPEHGRIGMTPCSNVNISTDDENIIITGTITDAAAFGYMLELERKIIFPKKGKEIIIKDTVTNKEAIPQEIMILYHFNFGYPLLSPKSRMIKGKGSITDNLGSGINPHLCGKCDSPSIEKKEEVYCHGNTPDKDGFGRASLINDKLGVGCYVKYRMDTLPYIIQWKNFCINDYAMGLEPSNSYILGRDKERLNGTLPILNPYESISYEVALGILDGSEEIAEYENHFN